MTEIAKPELICEHFEILDNICCEYCNAYPACPLHNKGLILVRQVRRNWEDLEPTGIGFTEPPYPDQDPAAKLCRYCHHTIENCICEHIDD